MSHRINGSQSHLMARTNAEETMPAMLLTVFGFIGARPLDLRSWPPTSAAGSTRD